MLSKIWNEKLLHIVLGVTFLIGLLPISNHMLPMQAMYMDSETSLRSTAQARTGDNSTGSCCEAIGSFLLSCDFVVCQSVCACANRDSEQIASSVSFVQSISIESLVPPPKA